MGRHPPLAVRPIQERSAGSLQEEDSRPRKPQETDQTTTSYRQIGRPPPHNDVNDPKISRSHRRQRVTFQRTSSGGHRERNEMGYPRSGVRVFVGMGTGSLGDTPGLPAPISAFTIYKMLIHQYFHDWKQDSDFLHFDNSYT